MLKLLPRIVDNAEISKEIKVKMEADRLEVTKEIGKRKAIVASVKFIDSENRNADEEVSGVRSPFATRCRANLFNMAIGG